MGEDYVDYTLLKKKGILKLKEDKLKSSLSVKDGFVDLTGFKDNTTNEPSSSTNSTTNMNNFGFLNDMASIGSSNSQNTPLNENDLSSLKIKIDDMEYKLERFIERLDKLEEKLDKQ